MRKWKNDIRFLNRCWRFLFFSFLILPQITSCGANLNPDTMQIKQFVFNHFQENCYLIWNEGSKECYIVDPGAEELSEDSILDDFIAKNQLKPVAVLLTHAHIDHVCGLQHVCERYQLPVTLHPDGVKLLGQAQLYGSVMNFRVNPLDELPTALINQGDKLAGGAIECRYVPGHCPGSMAFVLPDEKMVITGDALFRGSIGRTDLPGGDLDLLMKSLRTQLLTLDDTFMVLPGHGDASTIGEELMYNGFLQ